MQRWLTLLAIFLVGFIISLSTIASWRFAQSKTPVKLTLVQPTPTLSPYSLDVPPPDSLKGQIVSMNGDILWQSRSATQAALIKTPQIIQQGENLMASDSGEVVVSFANVGQISLTPLSSVNFAQTLPVDIVLQLITGRLEIVKQGSIPISVRVLHTLVDIQGDTVINTDGSQIIIYGPANIAYNNLQNISQIINIKENYRYVFSDATRRGKLLAD